MRWGWSIPARSMRTIEPLCENMERLLEKRPRRSLKKVEQTFLSAFFFRRQTGMSVPPLFNRPRAIARPTHGTWSRRAEALMFSPQSLRPRNRSSHATAASPRQNGLGRAVPAIAGRHRRRAVSRRTSNDRPDARGSHSHAARRNVPAASRSGRGNARASNRADARLSCAIGRPCHGFVSAGQMLDNRHFDIITMTEQTMQTGATPHEGVGDGSRQHDGGDDRTKHRAHSSLRQLSPMNRGRSTSSVEKNQRFP
jgi:hypothetical protein